MDSVNTNDETRKLKLFLLLACLLLSIFLQCWGQAKDDVDELMAMMMKQVQNLIPKDRNPFIELCVSKGQKCQENQFSGSDAIFSWRPGIESSAKLRFWGTYECVYQKKLQNCPGDGGWTEWSAWSLCRAECEDKGWQTRNRICENPKPKFGGETCEGTTTSNRSCSGSCRDNANGQDEAKEYITHTHSVSPELDDLCLKKHCYYDEVLKIIKDKSKVDKYWSSVICVKYSGPCPVNGGWGIWGEWSACSVKCGHGEQFRKRQCNSPPPKNGGIFCVGKYFETKICLSKSCTSSETYTDWSEYSMCSESCGVYGVKTSLRSCLNDKNCYIGGALVKEQVKTVPCYGGECPQIGAWSKWGPWAACSAKCGDGRRGRMRLCNSPAPSNGEDCPGANVYVESCAGKFCVQLPGDSDANARRRRSNIIFTPSGTGQIKEHLQGINSEQFYSKEESYWRKNNIENSSLSRTSFVSDQRVKTLKNESEDEKDLFALTRNVKNDTPAVVSKMDFRVASVNKNDNVLLPATIKRNNKYLEDRNFTYELHTHRTKHAARMGTKQQPATVDQDDPFNLPLNPDLELLFSEWSNWSVCTKTCGGGTRRRKRKCKNHKTVCRGEVWPMQFCNLKPCPVAGGWGTWMSWAPCSVTCGPGQSERFRACSNPLPSYGGSCSGINSQSQPCSLPKCTNTGFSSPWTSWSTCSASCDGGTRIRKRNIMVLSSETETALCNPIPCSENGLWAAWGGWSSCSLPCGLGSTFRDRTCTDPAPTYGGDPCEGAGSELQTCFAGPCIDEDDYGVLMSGTGYLKYAERGKFAGFFMVFLRLKIMQTKGTLFHHTIKCKKGEANDCELSILGTMAGKNVHLEVKAASSETLTMVSGENLQIDLWHDIFVMVTEGCVAMRLNDEPYTEKKFSTRLTRGLNFDGELFVGSNRLKQDGIRGIIGVLRRNFKVLLLFSMKSWLGYGAPSESSNVDKFQLPLNVRHPDFHGKYYSHLFFRKSNFLQVLIIFHLTGINGILLFNGGTEPNSCAAVTVKDGALEFCLNCGEKLLCRKAYELKLGQWYILRISVNGNEEQIRMNDGDAMQIMCPVGNKYVPRSSIYVGGAGALDLKIIQDVTNSEILFQGMIDTLVVNNLAATYKMATLVNIDGMVNSLGYSLADHVTEVHENEGATTTLRCGVPESEKHSHLVRLIWIQNMKRLVSSVGTEIIESDSVNQSVSTLSLKATHHYEGVYACLLSSDGVLVNLHVFILSRYKHEEGDGESTAEWVVFIVLLVLMLFVALPLLVFYCTKDHPFWNKCRGVIDKIKPPGQGEQQPLMKGSDTSGTTSGRDSSMMNTSGTSTSGTNASKSYSSRSGTPGTDSSMRAASGADTSGKSTSGADTSGKSTSGADTSGTNTPGATPKSSATGINKAPMKPKPPVSQGGAPPSSTPASAGLNSSANELHMSSEEESYQQPVSRGKKLSFADEIAIVMPPSGQQCMYDPDFRGVNDSECFGLNSDYPCASYSQGYDPCSTWENTQPCYPSHPGFIPRDIYGIPEPSSGDIEHIDFLRNPYYLSGVFNPFDVNQNNPTIDQSTNNAASDCASTITDDAFDDQRGRPMEVERGGSSIADKKSDDSNCKQKRVLYEKETCSMDTEMHCSKATSTRTTCEADRFAHFDGEFVSRSEQKDDPSSNICKIQTMNMNIFASNNNDCRKIKHTESSQKIELEETNLISFSKNNQKFEQTFCTGQSYYSCSQHQRHSQPLHKCHPHRACEAIDHMEKRAFTQSLVDDDCTNLVSAFKEQQRSEVKLTEQRAPVDLDLISESDQSAIMIGSQMLRPTTDVVRSMTKRHKRTKSLSKSPDTSFVASDRRGLHGAFQGSITTSSQRHSAIFGDPFVQLEASGSSAVQRTVYGSQQSSNSAVQRTVYGGQQSSNSAVQRTVTGGQQSSNSAVQRTVYGGQQSSNSAVQRTVTDGQQSSNSAVQRTVTSGQQSSNSAVQRTVTDSQQSSNSAVQRTVTGGQHCVHIRGGEVNVKKRKHNPQ